MSRVITILEVSQKQAYIFSSNKLKDNIMNSAVIDYALSCEYIEEKLKGYGYSDNKNMVYAGGGHTILTFESITTAKQNMAVLTEAIYRDFDNLTVFTRTIEYNESLTVEDNLKELTAQLEAKKSIRRAAFHKGSFGIEKIDAATLKPSIPKKEVSEFEKKVNTKETEYEKQICPDGYLPAYRFEDLGGTENETNFIAVVHIDGNGMGKRVEDLYASGCIDMWDFESARYKLREFSEGIDRDFKAAYIDMRKAVEHELKGQGKIASELSIKKASKRDGGDQYFPVRKVITAGDDICFVAEGRIGIECAAKFIEALNRKKNSVDGKPYTACAGVAIVHQKYPFYKAYEIAEMLCANAKSFNATVHPEDNGQSLSTIDWHIEYGELRDTLDEIREAYKTIDGGRLDFRPYIISGKELVDNDTRFFHDYYRFKKSFIKLSSKGLSTGKLKEMRRVLREGEAETVFYLNSNLLADIIYPDQEFVQDVKYDQRKHSLHFDAIELYDTYLPFKD